MERYRFLVESIFRINEIVEWCEVENYTYRDM